MNNHGYFSPSQLFLRKMCSASYTLQKEHENEIKDETTIYAQRGIKLHEEMQQRIDKLDFVNIKDDSIKSIIAEFLLICNEYNIDLQKANIITETQFIPNDINIINKKEIAGEDGWKVDCVIIYQKDIYFFDWKFGYNKVVDIAENLQMQAYAYALEQKFSPNKIYGFIIQPNYKTQKYQFNLFDIISFKSNLDNIINNCLNNPVFCIGEHCKYCKAKMFCNKQNKQSLELDIIKPSFLTNFINYTPQQRADIYEKAINTQKLIEEFIDNLKKQIIENNLQMENYTIKDGVKRKVWKNEREALEKLKELALQKEIDYNTVIKPAGVSDCLSVFGDAINSLIEIKEGEKRIVKQTKEEKKNGN